MYACASSSTSSSLRIRSSCARRWAACAPFHCFADSRAAFSSSAAAIDSEAAAAEPPAGAGSFDASASFSLPSLSSGVTDLLLPARDESLELLVDAGVDAGVRVLREQLFPAFRRDGVGGA